MIRIIEHGYKYHMETRCPLCGCRFSYDWEDVLKEGCFHYNDNYTHTYPSYRITCPECGNTFPILNWNFIYSNDENNKIDGITITGFTTTKEAIHD